MYKIAYFVFRYMLKLKMEVNALKKIKMLSVFFAAVILMCALMPVTAFALTIDTENGTVKPGKLQFVTDEYSYAWLNKLVIRDDATAIKEARIVPKAEYPYSATYSSFTEEVNGYLKLNKFDVETAVSAYNDTLTVFYYAATAMGMTADYDTMYSYLWDYGIRMPDEMSANHKVMVSCVYAAVKYDAVYALYEKNVSLPTGISLEGAAVNILAAFTGVHVPSGIDTIAGLSVYVMKDYIDSINEIPLSSNPDDKEIFYWMKAVTATKGGYEVPMIEYGSTTDVQKSYVDYAYFATVLNAAYDVTLNPFSLQTACESDDDIAVQTLILKTMLDEKGVDYSFDAYGQKLFDEACNAGCFMLDEDFYSDIYNYDVYVKKDCTKLWFTPFALADQLGGDNKYITVSFSGNDISSERTSYAKLDASKKTQTVQMSVKYDDGTVKENVTYIFNVIKTNETSSSSNDLISKIEDAVNAVVPEDNEKAQNVVDSVFSAITTLKPNYSENYETAQNTVLSTYANATQAEDEKTTKSSLGYLEELFGETYAENEIKSTSNLFETTTKQSVASKAVQAVKENPEIVFAPTGVVTVGGILGYFFTKKNKHEFYDETIESDENE